MVDERQPTGVAVGQHPGAVGDEWFACLAKRLAVGGIVLSELLGQGQGLSLPLGHSDRVYIRPHPAHGVDRIDGCGPGIGQRPVNLGQVLLETFHATPLKRPGALCQTVGGGGTDRTGAAHDHVGDGARRFDVVRGGDDYELMREQSLLDQSNPVSRLVEPYRPVMF